MRTATGLNALRFDYEALLYQELAKQPQVRAFHEQSEREHYFSLHKRHLLGTAVKITADLFPDIYRLYRDCLSRIGEHIEGDLYVHQDTQYNAHVYAHEQRCDILLTSALVREFNSSELAFVIGHELGHVLFEHNQIPAGFLLFDERAEQISPQLAKSLLQWSRAAEITADRIGFLACGDLSSAANAFFKTACGFHPGSDQQVLYALHAQFAEIERLTQDMQRRQMSGYASTHPLIPIRFKSLELISLDLLAFRNQRKNIKERDLHMINRQVQAVLDKTEPVVLQQNAPAAGENLEKQEDFAALLLLSLLLVASAQGAPSRSNIKYIQETAQRLQTPFQLDAVLQECKHNPALFREQVLEEMRLRSVSQDAILQVLHTCVLMCQPCSAAESQMMRSLCQSLRGGEHLLKAVLNQ